jgi:hypothetical protein
MPPQVTSEAAFVAALTFNRTPCLPALFPVAIVDVRSHHQFKAHAIRAL